MAQMSYTVQRSAEEWTVICNGKAEGSYLTQEAAFEAAAQNAGGDLRSGHSVRLEASSPTDPAGARDLGGKPVSGDGFS